MKIRIAILCAVISVVTPFTVCAQIILNFGVYTSEKPSSMVKKLRPILNELEAAMRFRLQEDVRIRMQVAHSYEEGIAQLVKGDVDFARLGPVSYVLAMQANDKLKIAAMEHKDRKKQFFGIIAVNESSEIKHISDLKGKSFAFGNEKSTIGRYLAQQILLEHGLKSLDFKKTRYLGRHDAVGAAVGSGQFDAGALKQSTFIKMRRSGHLLRELARFPNVTKPWVARARVDPRIFNALQSALLSLEGTPGLKKLKKSGFLEGHDSDYATIREAMGNNARFFE